MKKITLAIAFLLCFIGFGALHAQMLKEVPLKTQINNSSLVIEGEVIAKRSFWDANRQNIYTSNTIKVYKVFKGSPVSFVDVITSGGVVGTRASIVTPSLGLNKTDVGVFNLKNNLVSFGQENKSANPKYRAYASKQSFYKYNLYTDVVVNTFGQKKGISSSFYQDIMDITKSDYIEMVSFDSNQLRSNKLLPPASITFSPSTVTAGTKTVLTINGTGFGGTQGKVGFSNADDGGATFAFALDSQVLNWSDTEIMVEVPSIAGTGTILVQDSGAVSAASAATLTVTYAELNVTFDPDDQTGSGGSDGPLENHAYQTRHINENGSGGYTWQMQTDFFNDTEFPGAKADFETALDKWRCETDINWTISGSATTTDVAADDGINVVTFDNNAVPAEDLADGVLGRCTSYWSGCGTWGNASSWQWHVTELDIVFDDETSWHFGAGLPMFTEFDFESVALHELGHGHQLAHVIDPVADGDNMDDVMHYAISNSEQQRVFSTGNKSGGADVHSRSTTVVACGLAVMTNSSTCNLSLEEDHFNAGLSIFPNPASEHFQIKNASFIDIQKVVMYDISGRYINEYKFPNRSRTKTIDTNGISKGIYFLNIHSELASVTKKIVID